MKLLLDTHLLLWAADNSRRLRVVDISVVSVMHTLFVANGENYCRTRPAKKNRPAHNKPSSPRQRDQQRAGSVFGALYAVA
jgi:hypothetical protein